MKISLWVIAFYFVSILQTSGFAQIPTIEVYYYANLDSSTQDPTEEFKGIITGWKTTGATDVFLLSNPTISLPVSGEIEGSHHDILIATGPSGSKSATVGAIHTLKPGTARLGQLHKVVPHFDGEEFFKENSVVRVFAGTDQRSLETTCTKELEKRGFTTCRIVLERPSGSLLIHTNQYEPLSILNQTEDLRRKEGQIDRQAAFSILIKPQQKDNPSSGFEVLIRCHVRLNRPRDSKEWEDAPPDSAFPEARAILDSISGKLKK